MTDVESKVHPLRLAFTEMMDYVYECYCNENRITHDFSELSNRIKYNELQTYKAIELAIKHGYVECKWIRVSGLEIPFQGRVELMAEGIAAIEQDFIGKERDFNLVINQYGDQPVAQFGSSNVAISLSNNIPPELFVALDALVVAVDSLNSLPGKVAREIGEAVFILRDELAKPQPILERIGRAYNLLGSTASIAAVAQYVAPLMAHLKQIIP